DIGGEPPRPRGDRAPQPDAEPPEEQRIETPPRKRRHGSTPSTSQPERLERQMHKRNLLRHEVTNLPHHRSSHTLQFPRDNEDARGQASDLLTEILSEGRGQRMHAKLWIEVDEGGRRERQMVRLGDKGGYDCGFALEDVRMFRDALSWLEDQAGQQYGNVADRGRLVGVEIDVW
ncbi:helix-turn-helix domain containing protein, partial [Cutibacterium acnes]|uniref:helix-turn-helix domain containing protein n=1 Tax=Cutibacterium acnes TaxID=1747 RepID=UPI001F1EA523